MTHGDYFHAVVKCIDEMLGQEQLPSTSSEITDIAIELYTHFAAEAGIPDVYEIELCISSILFEVMVERGARSEERGTKALPREKKRKNRPLKPFFGGRRKKQRPAVTTFSRMVESPRHLKRDLPDTSALHVLARWDGANIGYFI